ERGDGRRETEKARLARLTDREKRELAEWRRTHRWHPHQLRHSAATRIRREFGLEAAQLVLGHSSAVITDAVYAERDQTKVAEVVRRVG
ncbi:MAG TPA: tyrosine-type recombinase/integrase, partial [Phycisphaerales bacterium]|nr:tyrosine-type recombinase/integrase [Phycisphaerales bacterium]